MKPIAMSPHRARLCLTVLATGLIWTGHAPPACSQTAESDALAGVGAWSPPVPLSGAPAGHTLRWPSLAVRGDTLYVAANLFPVEEEALLPRPSAVLLRSPGTPLPLPDGEFSFAYPKGLHDESGGYHLFWAEPRQRTDVPREWPRGPLVELWYAVHLPHGWSAPERVLAADRIDWGAEHGAVALDRRGTPHLALPVQSRASHPELTYLKREGGRWRETSFARIASYASLATAGDSVVIAFVGTRTGLRHDVNSLFVIRSPDGGESWKPAVLVPGSGPGLAYSPVLSAGDDGILHLVWREIAPPGGPWFVRYVRSGFGTDNWTETRDWSIPHETVLHVTAVAGACGEMVAFVESLGAEGIAVRELRSRGGALRESRLFPGAAGVAHVGAVHTDGVLRLVASVLEPNSQTAVSVRAQRPMCP